MKFLYSYFQKATGKSIVALADKYQRYIGQAKLHPDDKEYPSEYAGCRLAQKRAWVKYLRSECRRKKIMLQTIKNLNKDIQLNCQEINPKIQRRINLKLRDYTEEITELKDSIIELENQIKKDISTRDNLIKRSNFNKKTN